MEASTAETNGRSVEEMAEQGLGLEPEATQFIEGTKGQLSWNVGGLEPSSARLKVSGLTLDVAGEFRKGDEFQIVLDCRINRVTFADEDDPDGFPEVCVKEQGAKITSWRRLDDDQSKALAAIVGAEE